MKREQITMNKDKIKKCSDCLHCKVAFSPVKIGRLCFCAKRKNKEYETEFYWLNKSVCKKFVDMAS